MVCDNHTPNTGNDRVVINLHGGEADLAIDYIDVEVNEAIGFEVQGRIENLDDDVLASLSGHSVTPAELHFFTQEDAA